jgi:hypothetical protein
MPHARWQIWKLSSTDMCEIAQSSVMQSGYELSIKQHWLGDQCLDRNDIHKSNVPNIRVNYRQQTLREERNMVFESRFHFGASGGGGPGSAALGQSGTLSEVESLADSTTGRPQQQRAQHPHDLGTSASGSFVGGGGAPGTIEARMRSDSAAEPMLSSPLSKACTIVSDTPSYFELDMPVMPNIPVSGMLPGKASRARAASNDSSNG